MHPKWIPHLVNPTNHQPLQLRDEVIEGERIATGQLVDASSGETFAVEKGIARFSPLPSESQTSKSFGDKWNSEVFWDREKDDETVRAFWLEQLCAVLGCRDEAQLDELFSGVGRCLNAGCGYAWSEDLFNLNPEMDRFALDLSRSVEVAHHRTKDAPNVCVLQGNILSLPFRDDHFDIIFSNGVVHHTPDPRGAVLELCRTLKPGGVLGLYIYCVKPFIRELADKAIRDKTTKMTYEECYEFSKAMSALGKSFQRIEGQVTIDEDVPLLGIEKGTYNVQKFIYDHFVKCFFNSTYAEERSHLTNVDWYHPKYASHHTREEIQGWLDEGGIDSASFYQPPGWEHSGYFVTGRKGA